MSLKVMDITILCDCTPWKVTQYSSRTWSIFPIFFNIYLRDEKGGLKNIGDHSI